MDSKAKVIKAYRDLITKSQPKTKRFIDHAANAEGIQVIQGNNSLFIAISNNQGTISTSL